MTILDPASQRRRRWFLVFAVLSSCLFALGYSPLEVRQERIRAVIQPTIQLERLPRPPATDEPNPLAKPNMDVGGEKVSTTAKSSSPSQKDSCDDLRVLVDRSHPLSPNYVPGDLVSLWAYEIPTLGGGKMLLRRDAAERLSSLELARIGSQLFVFDSATCDRTATPPLFAVFDTRLSAQPLSFVAQGTLKCRDFSLYSGASSAHIAHFGWPKGRFNHQPHHVILRQRLCQLLQASHVGRKFATLSFRQVLLQFP